MREQREVGFRDAHRAVDGELAGSGGEQVLAADHVGDLHQHVVDCHRERVERAAVGALQHEVGHECVIEGDLAADQVGERGRSVRHPQPEHRQPALGLVAGHLLG